MTHAGFVQISACWVCGGSRLNREHDAILDLDIYRDQHPALAAYSGEVVWFQRCSHCGFTQPERLPALKGFFDLLYDQLWSPEWVEEEFESKYKDLIFRTILKGLSLRATASRRLLDVGAHAGRFMNLAHRAGWQPEGIELNARTAAFAALRTGRIVHVDNVDRLSLPTSRYGAITMIDVLEHVPDPLTVLGRVEAALEPGGWAVVKVPSGPAQRFKEGARARLQSGYRPRLADNLVHVNHFSTGALRLALARAGLRDITVEIAPPELPPALSFRRSVSNLFRQSLYYGTRVLPGGVKTPMALNLLAFGRKPS